MTHQIVPGRQGSAAAMTAAFTREMLQNLAVVMEAACEDQPVTVEVEALAVWAVTPDGARLFIGMTPRPAAAN